MKKSLILPYDEPKQSEKMRTSGITGVLAEKADWLVYGKSCDLIDSQIANERNLSNRELS
jgi:hypothetical protein